MKKFIPTIREIHILESFCRACTIVPSVYQFDIYDFFEKALQTSTFDRYFDDATVYTQADTYIVDTIVDELKENNVSILHKKYDNLVELAYNADIAYWAAYLFLSWRREENITGKEIVERYDIQWILDSYDSLHTTSIAYAVRHIKEEMTREPSHRGIKSKEVRNDTGI